jgi:hypothetical protein
LAKFVEVPYDHAKDQQELVQVTGQADTYGNLRAIYRAIREGGVSYDS